MGFRSTFIKCHNSILNYAMTTCFVSYSGLLFSVIPSFDALLSELLAVVLHYKQYICYILLYITTDMFP
jgi:hypothetical protein